MEISLKVQKTGNLPGTVGWLAENAAVLKVTKTTSRQRAVILEDKDGKKMTVLCVEDWNDDGTISQAQRYTGRDNGYGYELFVDFICTDACWKKLEEIIAYSVTLLDEPEEVADDYRVVFTTFSSDTPTGVVSDWLKEKKLIPQEAKVAG
jgi:hypothetical protein